MANAKTKNPNKTTNDPISDFLTRIRNATARNMKVVLIPHSSFKLDLANLLKAEGYVDHVEIVDADTPAKKSISIKLRYAGGMSVIQGLRKISKPGLRKYSKSQYAPKVKNGLGVTVLSTNQGLVTDRVARKNKVGGELICQIW